MSAGTTASRGTPHELWRARYNSAPHADFAPGSPPFVRTPGRRVFLMEFERLYRQHVQAVFRYALSVTRRRDVAEDLTSEAFIALHRHLESIDQSQLPGWLLTVVRNRARDWWRHALVEERYAQQVLADDAARFVEPPLERWILEAPDMKPVHRTCLVLRYVQGMTRAEVATATGLSETQVKGYLQYALKLLRKAHGVGEP